jgi:hypothetical protein
MRAGRRDGGGRGLNAFPIGAERKWEDAQMEASGEAPSFETDIKPLFREKDRDSMSGHFDLWSYDDVVRNADKILARVRTGTMPCDGAWPEDRVGLLARWVESGRAA